MQKKPGVQLKTLIEQGDIEAALQLLAAVETWPQKALNDALYELAWRAALPWTDAHLTLATALLDAGANTSATSYRYGGTPLHYAAKTYNLVFVTLLLARGVEVNAVTEERETPLHAALYRCDKPEEHLPVVRALLEAGADPNINVYAQKFRRDSDTPLMLAIEHRALEAAQLLVAHGADLNQRSEGRLTAIYVATKVAVEYGDLTFLEWLLELGADLNATKYRFDNTPLTIAAERNRLTLIDYLVQAGADVTKGHPLVTAASRGHLEAAERLLELGANVNEVASFDDTGLICAIGNHDTAMAKLLIDHGAPLNKPTKTCKGRVTPLEFAREVPQYNADIIVYMLETIAVHDADKARQETGRYYAAGLLKVARDPCILKPLAYWLEQGADPNSCNEYERTALNYVVERGKSLDEARLLLDAGANVNARDKFGYTPLHDSVLGDNAKIIQTLLDAGADPAARVKRGIHHGYTALEIARVERKENAIRLLTSLSPEPRPLTPCEPEFWCDGSLKGFSHIDYEENAPKNALEKRGERSTHIYLRQTRMQRYWTEKGTPTEYTEPCVRTKRYGPQSRYRGTGISRAEHPLRWLIAMQACLHCRSEDVLVIYADWCVQAHSSGDMAWSYEVKCNRCKYYSSWGYSDH